MFILQIVIILLATKLAGQLSIRLGQPSVLGKIIVGIILGPALLGWVHDTELVSVFSQIGVLLLMFLAGLETNLKDLNENKKSALFVALGGILAPIVMSYAVAQYYDFSMAESIFIGLLLSATSVSISVQVLRELGWLNSKEGSALLGAAVLDDIIVVILIAVAMSVFAGADTNIALLIGKKIIFFIIIILASKWLVPKFIQIFSKFKVTEGVLSAGLIICFGFAYFAEYVGVAGIIGTFFAGVAIAQTNYGHEIEKQVQPIAYGIFVPFFFVSIGLSVSFEGIGDQIGFMIVFSIIAILSKFIGSGIGARLSGFNNRSSMGIGAGMISRGEVALILAALGLEGGLLPTEYYTSMIIVIIVTTLVTPPLLKVFFGTRSVQ
ncbi:cation:proton antiporter [Ureibacillus acetophenoni]|uniref:Sodium/proton-potassium antiporter GerN (CPA2 family) n=1 Tax=Ureibacillus acetophenoni TaxID=614649 RepID=A0A285UU46_9BACL|nr:cation:proton antiporter [Ureibacillus acetophenoni]SOC44226.1 sodium/proton-potassium antiporter GerN (CPA2 family) [Ureibacillus acetophenoni]